jgi:hypothetical protein
MVTAESASPSMAAAPARASAAPAMSTSPAEAQAVTASPTEVSIRTVAVVVRKMPISVGLIAIIVAVGRAVACIGRTQTIRIWISSAALKNEE